MKLKELFIFEYVDLLKRFYSDNKWTSMVAAYAENVPFDWGGPERFQKPTGRPNTGLSPWRLGDMAEKKTIASTYKGLLFHKPAIDLRLYTGLIWELKPKTIIEFGSFHGGSGLWFADQMSVMYEEGAVHSFDYFSDAVSERAKKHPRLHFHHADLNNLETVDLGLLKSLPHPWMVVDDAHVNILNVATMMSDLMHDGDYFIKEDLDILGNIGEIAEYYGHAESLGFLVDSIYADAFGLNYSSPQSAWFMLKTPEGLERKSHEPYAMRNLSLETFGLD